jgi:hypothetical protein
MADLKKNQKTEDLISFAEKNLSMLFTLRRYAVILLTSRTCCRTRWPFLFFKIIIAFDGTCLKVYS